MKDVELAPDILLSLKEMFGEQSRSARQEQIYNTKMAEGTSVREHCLRMISHLITLEVLCVNIDGESQAGPAQWYKPLMRPPKAPSEKRAPKF